MPPPPNFSKHPYNMYSYLSNEQPPPKNFSYTFLDSMSRSKINPLYAPVCIVVMQYLEAGLQIRTLVFLWDQDPYIKQKSDSEPVWIYGFKSLQNHANHQNRQFLTIFIIYLCWKKKVKGESVSFFYSNSTRIRNPVKKIQYTRRFFNSPWIYYF